MTNYVGVLLAAGSSLALSACMHEAPVVYVSGCANAIPLRQSVIAQMNRQELIAYNKYKQFWKENCKEQINFSDVTIK